MDWKSINSQGLFYEIDKLNNYYGKTKKKWSLILEALREDYDLKEDVTIEALRCWFKRKRKEKEFFDPEIVVENVRLAKKSQKSQDITRIERKSFRDFVRVDNALEEYNRELINLLKEHSLKDFTIKHNYIPQTGGTGIVQFNDPHFNELVKNINGNSYDFNIAAKRCKKFITQAKLYFKALGISNVWITMLGDLINSDRRLDELLSNATNRSKASLLAVYIIEQMILDLNQDFNVTVASVVGNESRKVEHIGYTDLVVTDNYDWTIFHTLGHIFKGCEGVTFHYDDNALEQVINIEGQNILLLHGHSCNKGEDNAQKLLGKYASKGILIDFVLYGHYHANLTGDIFSRGSSIVGANNFSESSMQVVSRASQNIHIIYDKENRDSIKIDLQDVMGIEGYNIKKELEMYHVRTI